MIEKEKKIHERMLANIDSVHDKMDGSFIYDATKPAAMEFARQDELIQSVEDKLDIYNLVDDELTMFVYTRTGIVRKPATHASGEVLITGSVGTIVEKGTVVSNGETDYEVIQEHVVGESGAIRVMVQAVTPGESGNTPSDSITIFPVSVNGLIDVYNLDPFTNGYNAESDDDLRQRYFDKLQRPGKAGNVYHYMEWASEVIGVGGVRVIPRWDGPLTVKVVIIDANKKPADEELIQKVTNHIEEERPFGANVTVVSADAVMIDIQVNIIKHVGHEEDDIEQSITENINAYLASVAFDRHYISYARIGSVILNSNGVMDYRDLLVNGDTANIPIDKVEIGQLGTLTCTYVDVRKGGE